eukprot:GHVU01107305.1.p1 GENE.GHVU01107305.1~~GHVU01107305.1.p1  ORF type:complete len:522 (-),score=77.16 GHVU01107305.1:179-1693(-)
MGTSSRLVTMTGESSSPLFREIELHLLKTLFTPIPTALRFLSPTKRDGFLDRRSLQGGVVFPFLSSVGWLSCLPPDCRDPVYDAEPDAAHMNDMAMRRLMELVTWIVDPLKQGAPFGQQLGPAPLTQALPVRILPVLEYAHCLWRKTVDPEGVYKVPSTKTVREHCASPHLVRGVERGGGGGGGPGGDYNYGYSPAMMMTGGSSWDPSSRRGAQQQQQQHTTTTTNRPFSPPPTAGGGATSPPSGDAASSPSSPSALADSTPIDLLPSLLQRELSLPREVLVEVYRGMLNHMSPGQDLSNLVDSWSSHLCTPVPPPSSSSPTSYGRRGGDRGRGEEENEDGEALARSGDPLGGSLGPPLNRNETEALSGGAPSDSPIMSAHSPTASFPAYPKAWLRPTVSEFNLHCQAVAYAYITRWAFEADAQHHGDTARRFASSVTFPSLRSFLEVAAPVEPPVREMWSLCAGELSRVFNKIRTVAQLHSSCSNDDGEETERAPSPVHSSNR